MVNDIIIADCKEIEQKVDLSFFNNKSVLITGASGLIGTYILYTFYAFYHGKDRGNISVTVITKRGLPEHLKELENEKWINVVKGDLSEWNFLESLDFYDVIIHAAGYGQPGLFLQDKVKTLNLNSLTTSKLLSRVKPKGTFLFFSTSELYSGSKDNPYTEHTHGVTMPDHPRACYIEGKRCGEAYCQSYAQIGDINVRIARIALAYGPGVRKDDKRVLYNFIQKALLDKKIELLDSGMSERVYCYVSDTVEILFNMIIRGKDIVYNVGGQSKTTIRQLAQYVAEYFNVPVVVPQNDEKSMASAPALVEMDISKSVKEFNKESFVGIKDGLNRTINWYKQLFN